jgi:hypothetical protein
VSKNRRFRWIPFYLLVQLAALLLFFDEDIPMDDTLRMVILGAIVVLICALAMRWIERHPRLIESEGVDSLRGHHLLAGMSPYAESVAGASASEDEDAQYTPIRHCQSDE